MACTRPIIFVSAATSILDLVFVITVRMAVLSPASAVSCITATHVCICRMVSSIASWMTIKSQVRISAKASFLVETLVLVNLVIFRIPYVIDSMTVQWSLLVRSTMNVAVDPILNHDWCIDKYIVPRFIKPGLWHHLP